MSCPGFVQTRAAANADHTFQVVKYESHKSQKDKNAENSLSSRLSDLSPSKSLDTRKGIDIKRARREIIKFGMSGFDSQKKQEAKVALAVSLGAKPPKNPYKNYKLILEEKKNEKQLEDSQKKLQQAGKNPLGVSLAKKNFLNKIHPKKNKLNSGLLEAYGKNAVSKNKSLKNQKSKSR